MANLSDVKPASSRFRMLVLGILWIIQLTFTSIYVIILGLLIGITTKSPAYIMGDDKDPSNDRSPVQP